MFSFPLLIIAVVLEVMLWYIPNEYSYKKEYLDKYSEDIETLILGSSHTYGGLNPELFSSNTFNAGHNAQLLYYDNKILEKYKSRLGKLKTIILPIAYPTLFANYEIKHISHCQSNYGYYFGFWKYPSFEIMNNRLIHNLRKLKASYINKTMKYNCTKLGWSTAFNSKQTRDLTQTAYETLEWQTIENIKSEKNNKIFKENLSILRSILQWSKNNNVKVLLFTLPAYKTYRNNLNKEQLSRTFRATTDIADEYNNCIYFDLMSDNQYILSDFWDASHLSEFGAEKLSHFMDSVIQSDFKARTHNTLYK